MPRVRAVRRSADWGRRSVDWGKPSHGRRMSSAASLDEDLDVVFSDGSQVRRGEEEGKVYQDFSPRAAPPRQDKGE